MGELRRALAERLLRAELTHHLASAAPEATPIRRNSRNGFTPKTVRSEHGDMTLATFPATGKLRECPSVSQRSKGYFGFEFWCQLAPLMPRYRRFFSSTSCETPWGWRALNMPWGVSA